MDILCRFGAATVLFQELPSFSLWPFWAWKLDSYKIENGKPDVIVNYKNQPVYQKGNLIWEDDQTRVLRQFFALDDGRLLWQQTDSLSKEIQLQFVVSADWSSITLTEDRSDTVGMGAFEALTFIIFYAFIRKKILTFHGVLIEEGGRGFLLCAGSGGGKTTHARLWRKCKNALILNGDRASCYEEDGVWYGFGTPWCGTSGENINRLVPLQAVVLLERGNENIVSKCNGMSLFHHTLYPGWQQELTEEMLSLLDKFLGKIPTLKFQCTPDDSSVDVLYKALENYSL